MKPSVHERPPVTGPAQGGRQPGLLCDLQPGPPSLAPFLQEKGKVCSGLCVSCPEVPVRDSVSLRLTQKTQEAPGVGFGGQKLISRDTHDSWAGAQWASARPGAPPVPAPPSPPAHTPGSTNKGPVYLSQQHTHAGNPLENRVDFLKGGGGPSRGGLLTQGHPTLANNPGPGSGVAVSLRKYSLKGTAKGKALQGEGWGTRPTPPHLRSLWGCPPV